MLQNLFVDNDLPIEFRFIRKSDNTTKTLYLPTLDDPKLCTTIETLNKLDTYEVYYSPTLRKQNKSKATVKTDVVSTKCLWVDIDEPTYNHAAFLLPPSLVIFSGRGLQLYWVCTQYFKPADNLLKRLTKCYNADPACANIAAFLRFPNTLNHKYTPAPLATIISELDTTYSLDELKLALETKVNWNQWINEAQQSIPVGQRSTHEFKLIKKLQNLKFSEQTIKAIIDYHFSDTSKVKESERHIKNIINKQPQTITVSTNGNVPHDVARPDLSIVETVNLPVGDQENAIIEIDNKYFRLDKNGQPHNISNFIFELLAIHNGENSCFIVNIHSDDSVWYNKALDSKMFTSVTTFCNALPNVQLGWRGNDLNVRILKIYLAAKFKQEGLPLVYVTKQLGLDVKHDPTLYVTSDEIYTPDWQITQKAVYVAPSHEHPIIKKYHYTAFEVESFGYFVDSVLAVNDNTAMRTMLGWFMACHLKPRLKKLDIKFPHLIVSGSPGAGKTTTISKIFQPLMQYPDSQIWQANSTPFILLTLLGSTTSIPVCLTEFKSNTQTGSKAFLTYLKTAYDNGKDARGRQNQTTVEYPLTAPVCIDGEEMPHGQAIFDRTMPIYLDRRNASKPALDNLMKLDLHAFGSYAMECMLQITDLEIITKFDEELVYQDSNFYEVHDRIRKNCAMINTILHFIYKLVDSTLDENEPIKHCLNRERITPDLVQLKSVGRQIVYDFLESVLLYALSGNATDISFRKKDQKTIGLHLTSCYNWWLKYTNSLGKETTTLDTIKKQLKELEGGIFKHTKSEQCNDSRFLHLHTIDLVIASAELDIDVF